MVTKNTIYKWFSDFASLHLQIKEFGYGDFADISMEEATTYPLMWVSPQPCPVEGTEIFYTYVIAIADRCDKARREAVEIESDTFQICKDILAAADLQSGTDWELTASTTITPFIEKWKDEVEGNMFTIVLKVPFDYDECAVPFSGEIPPPPPTTCDDGTIKINGDSFDTVASGDIIDIPVKDTNGDEVGSKVGDEWIVPAVGDCNPATITLNSIAFGTVASGASGNFVVKNIDGTLIGSKVGSELIVPDATVQLNGVEVATPASGTTVNTLVKDTNNVSVGSLVAGVWVVPALVQSVLLKGIFGIGVDTMGLITIDSDNAGTYTSISDDGLSGSITISKNGGAYGAFSNPLVLAVNDTINVKRTVVTGLGYYKLTGTY